MSRTRSFRVQAGSDVAARRLRRNPWTPNRSSKDAMITIFAYPLRLHRGYIDRLRRAHFPAATYRGCILADVKMRYPVLTPALLLGMSYVANDKCGATRIIPKRFLQE